MAQKTLQIQLRLRIFRGWNYSRLFRLTQLITWVFKIGKPFSTGFRIRKGDKTNGQRDAVLLALRQSRDWTWVPSPWPWNPAFLDSWNPMPYACRVAYLTGMQKQDAYQRRDSATKTGEDWIKVGPCADLSSTFSLILILRIMPRGGDLIC